MPRSKVSMLPAVEPVKKLTTRELLQYAAAKRALKAHRRHGEKSPEFRRANNCRWLQPT